VVLTGQRRPKGRRRHRLLDGYTAYMLVFVVSGTYQDDYCDVFNDIAMTFDLAD
jgi:hypothetical protein